jgi:transposase-like protein
MTKKRQRRSADFKFRVALDAVKEQKTLSQLASEHEVHPGQITQWKKQLLDGGSSLFGQQHVRDQQAQTAREAELFEQIGRLQMELAWLKKTSLVACDIPPGEKRCRLPLGAHSSTIDCCIPKTRPRNLLVCGQLTSDQSP